jgi:hypothetical protein
MDGAAIASAATAASVMTFNIIGASSLLSSFVAPHQ